jgi:hypothetical protein
VTGADQASVTNNNRKLGGGKSGHVKTEKIAMAAPVNRVYNFLCEGENHSIDRNLLMGNAL